MLHTSARQVSTCVLGLIKAGARPRGRVYTVSDRLPYVTTCEMHSMCHGTAFLPWFCYQQKTEARIGEPHLTEYLLVPGSTPLPPRPQSLCSLHPGVQLGPFPRPTSGATTGSITSCNQKGTPSATRGSVWGTT